MFKKGVCLNRIRHRHCLLLLLVFLCSCAADLTVRDIHKEQFTSPLMVMKATVENQGNKAAGESSTSLKRRYSWNEPFEEMARMDTPSLALGQSQELPLWLFPPTALPDPGQCLFVQVCADAAAVVGESDENNNCLSWSYMNRQSCPECDRCCDQNLPIAFDWRSHHNINWVTAVRDQANCGSCWAFSAVAAIEAKNNVEAGASQQNPIDLSEQQLLSCAGGGGSCLGGWPSTSLNYARVNGIVGEATLSYTSTNCITGPSNNLTCLPVCDSQSLPGCADPLLTAAECAALPNPSSPGGANPPDWRIGTFQRVQGSAEADIKRALLCHGPLSVVSTNWRHAILLVAWDDHYRDQLPLPTAVIWTAAGWSRGAWIIKNSWGAGWGDNGYLAIPFSGHDYSDIANLAWYAQEVRRRP